MKPKARPREAVMWFIFDENGRPLFSPSEAKRIAWDRLIRVVGATRQQLYARGYRAVKCKVVPL